MSNSGVIALHEATHTYLLDGKLVPGVTRVLEDQLREMENIPAHLVAGAGEFGKHVHAACDLIDRGALDWASLDERLAPYARAYVLFRQESQAQILAGEMLVYHPTLKYAGKLDRLAMFPRRKYAAVLDIKSAAMLPRSVGAQTAAYREALLSMRIGWNPDTIRYSLHLRGDGTYRLDRLTNRADFTLFQSALNLWRFRHGST